MRLNPTIIYLFAVVILISCKEPLVTFKAAQPENVKQQKIFPKKLIGRYFSENAELIIGNYSIIEKLRVTDTFKISDLDKSEVITRDTLYNRNTGEKYRVFMINDSLFSNYIYSDTTFNLNRGDILKKYKGYYFLNRSISKTGFWDVEKVNLSKGILTINGIETEDEINLLETVTEARKDSARPFAVKPTKKQFKEFIRKNGFREGKIYLKE